MTPFKAFWLQEFNNWSNLGFTPTEKAKRAEDSATRQMDTLLAISSEDYFAAEQAWHEIRPSLVVPPEEIQS